MKSSSSLVVSGIKDTPGRYIPLKYLGEGGMSNVFKIFDRERGHDVALKVLDKELAGKDYARERFHREFAFLKMVNSPFVVEAYEEVQLQDNLPAYTMKYLPGGDLYNWVEAHHDGSLPLRFTASVMVQLALALDAIHKERILHRDVKPEQVLIVEQGTSYDALREGEVRVYLIDLGIGKLIDDAEDRPLPGKRRNDYSKYFARTLTDLYKTVGTPEYMSPEQVGNVLKLDYRSDLYSLGIVLYEMITGHVPFPRGTNEQKANAHLTKALRLPHEARGCSEPIPLEEVCCKLLQKDRNERYQTAREVVHAILAALPEEDRLHF